MFFSLNGLRLSVLIMGSNRQLLKHFELLFWAQPFESFYPQNYNGFPALIVSTTFRAITDFFVNKQRLLVSTACLIAQIL